MRYLNLIACILFVATSCSSDDDLQIDQKLQGEWVKSSTDNNVVELDLISFKSDGSYFSSREGFDATSGSSIGFLYQEAGNYSSANDRLDLNIRSYRTSGDGSFKPATELQDVATGNPSFTYQLTVIGELILTPICEPNQDCSGAIIYQRRITNDI
ncbi:hypothetical protein [Nonlabens antarcticus]|uniref:hypothetical protein n=1 Tax=Nonlabens antarcticus TaxID=392714 RepID=UPI001891DE0D|nr:hypothetical protein [Nonlabens antarcticus]